MGLPPPAVIGASSLLGTATGLRSQMGLAVVVLATPPESLPSWLRGAAVRPVVASLALGELVADKLPSTPNRTDPVGLIARIALGGLSSAVLASTTGRDRAVAAIVGAGMAAGAAFAGMAGRAALSRHLPPILAALNEDVVAAGLAVAAVRIATLAPTAG